MLPFITTSASSSPVALRAAERRSGYFLLSLNFKISVGLISPPISSRPSSSRIRFSRVRAPMLSWWLHLGQTWKFCATSVAYWVLPQDGHLRHRPSGTPELLLSAFLIFGGRILSNQLILTPSQSGKLPETAFRQPEKTVGRAAKRVEHLHQSRTSGAL